MPKLSNFQRTKKISFQWEDSEEILNLVVKPDHFTGQNLAIMQQAIEGKEDNSVAQHKFLCEFLCTVVESWDLEDDNGSVIPIDTDIVFDLLPITLVSSLLDRVQKELKVNPPMPES